MEDGTYQKCHVLKTMHVFPNRNRGQRFAAFEIQLCSTEGRSCIISEIIWEPMYDRHEGCGSRMKAKSSLETVTHRLLCGTGGSGDL